MSNDSNEKKIYPVAVYRHSLAHILAQAVQRTIDPAVHLGTGPAVEDGFYYDMLLSEGITIGEENLKALQKSMEQIAKEGQTFVCYKAQDIHDAHALCQAMGQPFKTQLIDKFAANGETNYTFYANVVNAKMRDRIVSQSKSDYIAAYDNITELLRSKKTISDQDYVVFLDLCEGGHVESTKEIADGSFALEKIAGAYRQGNDANPMMTRIYGTAFVTKDELKAYQLMMEEARKRDHRILGAKLKIFTISELVGSGLPLFQPNGMIIRKELTDYLRSLHKHNGYQRVWTPHLAKEALYECSGHAGHYLDDMFHVHGGTSNEDFFVKPMNCPMHVQLFADNQFSYRDMPIRYFEPATVYRDEKTGQLSGLTRVRSITQDDGHLFCRVSQIKDEVTTVVKIIKTFYATMGMMDGYWVSLSVRGEDKTKYLGTDEAWDVSEAALKDICDDMQLNYKRIEGEAAFYGPKLDFMFKDAIGRQRQLATVQLDFNQPNRFDLSFINEQGEKERPVMIHRAISGSLERFIGVMIEHFAGAFPLWLAPTQVMIIPVAEAFADYSESVKKHLAASDIRTQIDHSDDSFAKKIRNAEMMKIPYILILGEKEQTDGSVSVRVYKTKEQYVQSLADFTAKMLSDIKDRVL